MRRPRSERMPVGQPGVWHILSRCVRREMLLEPAARRQWVSERMASWLDILAVDLLGYALMGNHFHLVVRTRPDQADQWTEAEVAQRLLAAKTVRDGRPMVSEDIHPPLSAKDINAARGFLAHPGAMLRAVKEGFARLVNQQDGTAGHVWESRYQDVALLDVGGVVACLVYVDLNPFRAGLIVDPSRSSFCSARHRRGICERSPDALLGKHLVELADYPILDSAGCPLAGWAYPNDVVAQLTRATARCLRNRGGIMPTWADEILHRLGLASARWSGGMAQGGAMSGNVLAAIETRQRHSSSSRTPSDKSGLFLRAGEELC